MVVSVALRRMLSRYLANKIEIVKYFGSTTIEYMVNIMKGYYATSSNRMETDVYLKYLYFIQGF